MSYGLSWLRSIAPRWIAFASGLLIVAMGLLPQDFVGPQLPPGHYALALSIGLGWQLFLLHMMVGKMTRAATMAGHSMACLREERLSDAGLPSLPRLPC